MTTPKTLEEKILQKIKEKGVKQKPRWQFILHTVFLTSATIIALLVTFYLISFVSLVTREQDLVRLFGFGPNFTFAILAAMPWMLLFLIGLLLVVLQILVRHFAFGYERTVLTTLTLTIGLAALVSYGFYSLDKNMNIARFGEGKGDLLKPFHDRYRSGKQPNLFHGIITSVDQNTYTLETFRGSSTVSFIIASSTKQEPGVVLSPGQSVFVIFKQKGTTTTAVFVRNNPPREPRK